MQDKNRSALTHKPDVGITMREYYAGIAMQAISSGIYASGQSASVEEIAGLAVSQADALLEELDP